MVVNKIIAMLSVKPALKIESLRTQANGEYRMTKTNANHHMLMGPAPTVSVPKIDCRASKVKEIYAIENEN